MTAPLRVGVVGLGVISRFYLDAIDRMVGADLAAVADIDEDRLATCELDVPRMADHRELFASKSVDAVVLTVPNDLHHRLCDEALRAGKHVCCEKPLTLDPAAARELQQLAEDRGLILFTAFHRRYNENVRRLRQRPGWIRRGELEYRERIEEHCGEDAWYLDPARSGGGCLADNGPNAFDTLDFLLGPPRVIEARIECDYYGVDRQAEVILCCGELRTPARVLLDWSYPFGERKQVTVDYGDGTLARADMLEGWPGFKSSLHHEYERVIADFTAAVVSGEQRGGDGAAISELVADAYAAAGRGLPYGRPLAPSVPGDKVAAAGRFVKLLDHTRHDRGMSLAPLESRCVRTGEIHEIVTTDQVSAVCGDAIDRVGFLGFAEFNGPCVLEPGDTVTVAGRTVGRLIGFDECHAPNHYNLLIAVPGLLTATALSLRLGDSISIGPAEAERISDTPPGSFLHDRRARPRV